MQFFIKYVTLWYTFLGNWDYEHSSLKSYGCDIYRHIQQAYDWHWNFHGRNLTAYAKASNFKTCHNESEASVLWRSTETQQSCEELLK
jgi:hypothetical protein